MVVYQNGKPKRSEYKCFKIKDMEDQDDYASMQQVLQRRFHHYINGDKGFDALPDLLLIDGGIAHAKVANEVLSTMDLSIPLYGMVKDDRHRTRALVDIDGNEIRIDNKPAVFAFVGTIQEETHRFAISYHRKLRAKRMRYSELDQIPGIGPKRKQQLLNRFKSISAIKSATLNDLLQVLPADAAHSVYHHYRRGE
jgi:excinuclease ABC subunit C